MEIIPFRRGLATSTLSGVLQSLKKGGLVIYPTETCYGIGADATNEEAVAKLLAYKGGRGTKAISIAVSTEAMAVDYVELNTEAKHLYHTFLPGPITVISQSKGKTSKKLESINKTLGVRVPNYPNTLKLIEHFGKPITATSANTSGKKPPYSIDEYIRYTSKNRISMVDAFLDAGHLAPNPPSTVVDTTLHEPTILRAGSITLQQAPIITHNEEETIQLGRQLMERWKKSLHTKAVVFALQGKLGTGKTHLAKGIAQSLGITETVNSPTYTLMKEYPYSIPPYKGTFYHIDAWRLKSAKDLLDIDFLHLIHPQTVIAVEWLEKVLPALTLAEEKEAQIVWVTFKDTGLTQRVIRHT